MKKIILAVIILLFLPFLKSFAQTVEDVTLVTSASAPTEEEAIVLALRSAIEQTYGSFVSANTSILNDEIVRDEVVSVSHGNVKSYEKLSSVVLSNGQVEVALNSTISISNLISFAKNKGAEAEFAGQTFAMNIKLMKLKEKNTQAAYDNMIIMATELLDGAFDYKISLGEPRLMTESYRTAYAKRNGNWEYAYKTNGNRGYLFDVKVQVLATPKTSQIYELITNTLNSIKLSEAEQKDFREVGKGVYMYIFPGLKEYDDYRKGYWYSSPDTIYLPIVPSRVLNQALFEKAKLSFLNYSLVSISNNESYLSWQKQVILQNPVFYSGTKYDNQIYMDYEGNRREKDHYFLVNSDGSAIQDLEFFMPNVSDYNGRDGSYGKHYDGKFFQDGEGGWAPQIDHFTNWAKWKLPKYNVEVPIQDESSTLDAPKKKKKNKKVPTKTIEEYSTIEQVIVEYSLPFFIAEEQMESFAGLRVQTPSLTLQAGGDSHELISSTVKEFISDQNNSFSVKCKRRNYYPDIFSEPLWQQATLTFNSDDNTLSFAGAGRGTFELTSLIEKWHSINDNSVICAFDAVEGNRRYRILFKIEGSKKYIYVSDWLYSVLPDERRLDQVYQL